jgi:hypothetical protein
MSGSTPIRALGVARIGVGCLWLAALVTDQAAAGAALPRAGRLAATALAVRDIAQGALLTADPQRRSAETGAVVDCLHAASMLPVVALVPRYRTAAAVSAGAAVTWIAAAAWALRGQR